MSETAVSFLISVGIIVVLALSVPCLESLVGLLRRVAKKRIPAGERLKACAHKRDVA